MNRASCGLIYGAMNTTKTTNLGRIARWLFVKYGLRSRLISADNEWDTIQPEIDEGIIEAFAIAQVPNPFPICAKLSLGEWPEIRNSQLIMTPTSPNKMATIGAYLIEGTTTIAELLHQDHIRKARKIGEDLVGKFEEDGITFAKSAMSHYGHVQDYVTLDLIPRFAALSVRWVWWTGHEYVGEDEATGQTRFGPGVVGKAAVMKVPRKLGNTFHLTVNEEIETDARTHKSTRKIEYRAYYEPHADKNLTRQFWPAGVKLPVASIPRWRDKFPGGYIPLTLETGLEQFLEFHDEVMKSSGDNKVIQAPVQTVTEEPSRSTTVVSQTRPPVRPFKPPTRPIQPVRAPQPSLEEQLQKSIDQVQADKAAKAASITELPSINTAPAVENSKGE